MSTKVTLEETIIECAETDYKKYKTFIYRTFAQMMDNMRKIRPISERILELILENDDVDLLKKYSYYYTFIIVQSYSHYIDYAHCFGAVNCKSYIEKLNRCVYFHGNRK